MGGVSECPLRDGGVLESDGADTCEGMAMGAGSGVLGGGKPPPPPVSCTLLVLRSSLPSAPDRVMTRTSSSVSTANSVTSFSPPHMSVAVSSLRQKVLAPSRFAGTADEEEKRKTQTISKKEMRKFRASEEEEKEIEAIQKNIVLIRHHSEMERKITR